MAFLREVSVSAEELLSDNLDLSLLITKQTTNVITMSWQAADSQSLLPIAIVMDRVG